ncbi:MAG: hypothetical protein IH914_04290 [candidate division Zixibacteria bacterium]|nr:hypothetical protein [candidate division Zixibacteria bacterium]
MLSNRQALCVVMSMALLAFTTSVSAQQNGGKDSDAAKPKAGSAMVEFNDLRNGDLLVQGFELSAETRLILTAVGSAPWGAGDLQAYGWILDAETREPVWVMDERDTDRFRRSSSLRKIEDEISLPAGKYEAYYYVGDRFWGSTINFGDSDDWAEIWNDLGELLSDLGDELADELDDLDDELDDLFDDDDDDRSRDRKRERRRERLRDKLKDRDWDDYNDHNRNWNSYSRDGLSSRELRQLYFTVSAQRDTYATYDPEESARETMVVDFRRVSNDERLQKGFTLSREMKLIVRASGEYSQSGAIFVDHGWIVDADTRKRVWEMDKWSTRYAGGARKNRDVQEEITLPAGNYLVYYMSDGSHSYDEWNAQPPFDPLSYGISVMVTDKADKSNVTGFTYNPREAVILAIDRVGNHAFESQGFRLKKDTQLRIHGLGEFAFNAFADYGWIENTATMHTVWEMDEDNTTHAGGATKNREFDNVITLSAGEYIAYYVSDGSHSYRSWNSAKPFEPKKWGLTVYGVGKNFDKNSVTLFDEKELETESLASLTRLGDDEDVSKRFTLTAPTTVRIYALGEGSGGRMHDYGWIENYETGRTVWKMRYRRTRHAGGAKKNRLVNVTIDLEPGEYEVIFVTDGSHSFRDFNASRPRDPQRWGITISKK